MFFFQRKNIYFHIPVYVLTELFWKREPIWGNFKQYQKKLYNNIAILILK